MYASACASDSTGREMGSWMIFSVYSLANPPLAAPSRWIPIASRMRSSSAASTNAIPCTDRKSLIASKVAMIVGGRQRSRSSTRTTTFWMPWTSPISASNASRNPAMPCAPVAPWPAVSGSGCFGCGVSASMSPSKSGDNLTALDTKTPATRPQGDASPQIAQPGHQQLPLRRLHLRRRLDAALQFVEHLGDHRAAHVLGVLDLPRVDSDHDDVAHPAEPVRDEVQRRGLTAAPGTVDPDRHRIRPPAMTTLVKTSATAANPSRSKIAGYTSNGLLEDRMPSNGSGGLGLRPMTLIERRLG